MVALLNAGGKQGAAIRLEELWNELGKTHPFLLFCAYPLCDFHGEAHTDGFMKICGTHSAIMPTESYTAVSTVGERMRAIALLQQQAVSLAKEVEEHRNTASLLARRERELADFLEHAVQPIHQVGPDGTILWTNKAELDLLGYSPEEYLGHHIAEFHADASVIEDLLARLLRGESVYDYPARLRAKDGSLKDVLIHSNGYFEKGQFIHSRCFTRDITERKRAEEQIRTLNEELREKILDLETFHDVAVGRELVIMKLEDELAQLKKQLKDMSVT
jgi:PAS domain S-box-containing protein